jgi:hypothetical protein
MENSVRHFFQFFDQISQENRMFCEYLFSKKVIVLKKLESIIQQLHSKPWTLGWRGERFAIVPQNVIF